MSSDEVVAATGQGVMDIIKKVLQPSPAQLAVAAAGVGVFTFHSTTQERYDKISNLHSVPAVSMALLSFGDVIPEWAPMIYSFSYMAVDGVIMAVRLLTDTALEGQGWKYVLHHFAMLPMYLTPFSAAHCVHYKVKTASRLLMIETSNPFLHKWERTREHSDFLVLYPLFCALRTGWLGWLVYDTSKYGGSGPWIGGALWITCQATWSIPNFKYLDADTHNAKIEEWRAEGRS